MINFRIIARVFSLLLIIEGLFMLVPMLVSLIYHEETAKIFFYSALISTITGIIVFTPLRHEEKIYGNREGYIIVTGIWIVLTLFGTLPYLLSGSVTSFSDAFFESISGFTTTGATIFTDVESLPHGILFWRSMTQWLGGIGIIIISLTILPIVKAINVQISTTEFSGQTSDKIHPRIKDTGKRLVAIYVLITLVETILLASGEMSTFDAVCHSFSTMSTGGFMTHNNGIAAFSTPFIRIVLTVFMFIAGTNITLIYFGLKSNFKKIFRNTEFLNYIIICIVFSIIVSVVLMFQTGSISGNKIIDGFFQVISIVTTTGFYNQNYNLWGSFLILILFMLMFTGGTAGSTSGGIKVIRLAILTKNNRLELRRLIHPNAFIPVRFNHKTVPQSIVYNVLVFVTLYFLIVCISTLIISIMGYDIITSFGTSAAMLGNIGPGLGTLGPFCNYSAVPFAGKWFMAGLMLLGRLELMTVLILFSKSFYRN
jgi:trk system potassium uptake protein TrkH